MSADLNTILARTRENARRQRLHRQIAALESKLEKLGSPSTMLKRNRAYRLTSKLKRLRAELQQPELFF